MSGATPTPEDGTASEIPTRSCCLCATTGPEVVLAGPAERPSGPAVEYWACPACAPTVALLCQS